MAEIAAAAAATPAQVIVITMRAFLLGSGLKVEFGLWVTRSASERDGDAITVNGEIHCVASFWVQG